MALEEVYLYSNDISRIDEDLFSASLQLRRVELQRNRLECIPFESLALLTSLSALVVYGNPFGGADDLERSGSCTPLHDVPAVLTARLAAIVVNTSDHSLESEMQYRCPGSFVAAVGENFEMLCSRRPSAPPALVCICQQALETYLETTDASAFSPGLTGCRTCDLSDSDGLMIVPEVPKGCPAPTDCSAL